MSLRNDLTNLDGLLTTSVKRRLRRLAIMQAASALLDFTGVVLLGAAVASLATDGPSIGSGWIDRFEEFLGNRGVGNPEDTAVVLIAVAAALSLLTKSLVSLWLNRRVALVCADASVEVASELWNRRISDPLLLLRGESSQETAYMVNYGVNSAVQVGVSTVIAAVGDLTTLALLVSLLFFSSFSTAAVVVVFFGCIVVMQQRILSRRVSESANAQVETTLAGTVFIQDTLGVYREIASAGSFERAEVRYRDIKRTSAESFARMVFLQSIPRYASEIAFVLGGALIVAVGLSLNTWEEAASILAVYLLSSSRILPALLRLQNGALNFRMAAVNARSVYEFRNELNQRDADDSARRSSLAAAAATFDDTGLVIDDLDFQYPNEGFRLEGLSATVRRGESLALVGRSGSGKSTYANLIVGLLPPSSGSCRFGGVSTRDLLGSGRLRVGYVPQECYILDSTLRENVTIGLSGPVSDERIEEALRRAHLGPLLEDLPMGLDTQVGERGASLSGGQRQRLAVARALCAEVDLLVLDEATSALDAETETAISAALEEIMKHAAVVLIAHRLSTVRQATVVAYLDRGAVRATGTFDEVTRAVPEFAHQAELLGIETTWATGATGATRATRATDSTIGAVDGHRG